MILSADGRPLSSAATAIAATHDLTALADVGAACFLLSALVHGPERSLAWSGVVGGHPVQGPFIAVRATRHGVQKRVA